MAVGVLALQGSFNEHIAVLRRIGVQGLEIRKPEQLADVDALIIPGGESTTMAKLANYHNLVEEISRSINELIKQYTRDVKVVNTNTRLKVGDGIAHIRSFHEGRGRQELLFGDTKTSKTLVATDTVLIKGQNVKRSYWSKSVFHGSRVDYFLEGIAKNRGLSKPSQEDIRFPSLREFVNTGKPVWGTCAGLIFLANKAIGQKSGGQELIGGLDCTVNRNFFGSQLESFETELSVPKLADKEGGPPSCRGIFIRAPAILEAGQEVEVLADYHLPLEKQRSSANNEGEYTPEKVIVAVRQGNILATAFHPELTSDSRWHKYFLRMGKVGEGGSQLISKSYIDQVKSQYDLPIFE